MLSSNLNIFMYQYQPKFEVSVNFIIYLLAKILLLLVFGNKILAFSQFVFVKLLVSLWSLLAHRDSFHKFS